MKGQKYEAKKKSHPVLTARDSDNRPLLSNPYTVSNPRKVDRSDDPKVNVNRTNKGDYRSTVAHKNQRRDPVPRLQGSDDMRAIDMYGRKRRKQNI